MSQKNHKTVVAASGLDDRLGVFIILHVLPAMNINVDVLLSTGEEKGRSTARYAIDHIKKKYNWLVEFDRRGDDVVMYEYKNAKTTDIVESFELEVGRGSYTDICDMWELEIVGFNFGVGYYRAHSVHSFAVLDITAHMIAGFVEMYNKYKDTLIESDRTIPYRHRPKVVTKTTYPVERNDYGWDEWRDEHYDEYYSKAWLSFRDDVTAASTGGTQALPSPKDSNKTDRQPYYVDHECYACGQVKRWLKKGEAYECVCHLVFMRCEYTGHIFEKIWKGRVLCSELVKKIGASDISFDICYLCSSLVYIPNGSEYTHQGIACNRCVDSLFTECEICGYFFFSNKLQDFGLCAYCDDSSYIGRHT
jgi:hypothetical protein